MYAVYGQNNSGATSEEEERSGDENGDENDWNSAAAQEFYWSALDAIKGKGKRQRQRSWKIMGWPAVGQAAAQVFQMWR